MSSDDFEYENDLEEEYSEGEYPPDAKTQIVKGLILERFEKEPLKVYFQRQLEVLYEKPWFHWVTDRAINELVSEGKIKVEYYPIKVGAHHDKVKVLIHKSNRYYKLEAKRVCGLVEQYSAREITQDVGYWGQELFKVAYSSHGFKLLATDVNQFEGKLWRVSKKNLDFVVEKNGKRFGCEVKNTLGYMDKEEWQQKLEMCKFFGIIPIFIVRYSPTCWNYEIFEKGGLVQVFETQVFMPGRASLVNQLREELGLPVIISRRIPDSIMERLNKTLEKRVFKKV